MTNLSQRWVPRGSQRSTYSAPTIASAKLFSVRLRVAAIIRPPGCTISAQRCTNSADVGDVLDHLHGQHHVEALALVGQLLRGGAAIVDRSPAWAACARAASILASAGIGADHRGAEPGQRLGQDAAAAADVEDAQARQAAEPLGVAVEMRGRRLVADIAEPHRIELVQRRHLAARVPPFGGQRRKPLDLGLVDGAPTLRLPVRSSSALASFTRARLQPPDPAGMYTRLFAPGARHHGSRAPFASEDAFAAMARLVMKFGGTSVADIDRIRNVARHVKREVDAGHEVAVVVSAMSGKTNELVAWCREAAPLHDAREYDAVVASGEQVTAGLLAITLEGMGINARSWQGWQLPILTCNAHGSARILDINGAELVKRFKERKEVAVIAGFQGMHKDTGRITTLGRGGSDTSAVAIAAAIEADRCDIYTDVDGVYTTDPRVVPRAQRLDKIAFEEMLELASLGAKVLQVRSVELGMVHKVRDLRALELRKPEDIDPHGTPPGTLICDEEEIVEQQVVTGIAFSKDEAQISIRRVQDKPGVAAAIFGPLAEASINVDMIVQNVSADGKTTDLTFTVPAADYQRAIDVLGKAKGADRLRAPRRRHRRRQGLGDRHRHAQPRRRRRRGVQGAGRTRHQHPRDHHVRDQVLGADRRRLHRARGAHAAFAVRAGQVKDW